MAAHMLAQARTSARRRSYWPARKAETKQRRRLGSGIADPVLLGRAVGELLKASGWETTEVHETHRLWSEIVGSEFAKHVQPVAFDSAAGKLKVQADSKAWATQIRILAPQLIRRLNEETRTERVRTLQVLSPQPTDGPRPSLPLPVIGHPAPRTQPVPSLWSASALAAIRREQNEAGQAAVPALPSAPPTQTRRRQAIRLRALARARAAPPATS